MKTTYDAVNEFKGEWPCNDSIVMYFTKGANGCGFYSKFYRDNIESAVTDEEFNDLVLQMETNFGRWSEIAIQAWKDGDKELLTKSTKELEVMEIESNDPLIVPESVNHRCSYNFTDNPVDELEAGGYSNKRLLEIQTAMSKPLAYTQAMADNGEFPSVGMECLAMIDLSWQRVEVLHKKINGQGLGVAACRIISEINGQCGILKWCMDFKPLTPPIELIDGKAYQFELCFGDYRVGYYCSVRNSFFDGLLKSHKICGKAEATNIQPLTVEVK